MTLFSKNKNLNISVTLERAIPGGTAIYNIIYLRLTSRFHSESFYVYNYNILLNSNLTRESYWSPTVKQSGSLLGIFFTIITLLANLPIHEQFN